jgi:UDP-N-acetylmuramate dehydrogenase
MKILNNYSLKNYNTFGVNANAEFFTEVNSIFQLKEILSSKHFTRIIILGGGSNILFTSSSISGLVMRINFKGIDIIEENDSSVLIDVSAGIIWDDLVKFCVERNYGGIENLSLIPGSVGAAPIQNIGAYGQEFKDVFELLTAIRLKDLDEVVIDKNHCNFGYRNSIFKNELSGKIIITNIRLRLSKNPKINIAYGSLSGALMKKNIKNPNIKDLRELIIQIRSAKLPDPKITGNAGSIFKNPQIPKTKFDELKSLFSDVPSFIDEKKLVKISAAWLIEKAGLKGKRIGDVGTHPDQPLVIVNYGNASGKEIFNFAMNIRNVVAEKFGVDLEPEVNIIG